MTPFRNIAAAALLLAMMASGCTSSTEKKITFEIAGPVTADVTYGIGTDQSQELGATLPWKKELTSSDELLITVISAQSKGSGEISCKITIDGKVIKENKSSGEFATVTCTNG